MQRRTGKPDEHPAEDVGKDEIVTVHGVRPLHLIEKIVLTRIWDSPYFKEHTFGLSASTLLDKAVELRAVGGLYGNQKVSDFLCLLAKLLMIHPGVEVAGEYIGNPDFKYLRILGAFYIRLVGTPQEVYRSLEPLLEDYRKLRFRGRTGYRIVHVDEFIDMLLTEERVCDVILPRLAHRQILEELGDLDPRVSKVEAEIDMISLSPIMDGGAVCEHNNNTEEARGHQTPRGDDNVSPESLTPPSPDLDRSARALASDFPGKAETSVVETQMRGGTADRGWRPEKDGNCSKSSRRRSRSRSRGGSGESRGYGGEPSQSRPDKPSSRRRDHRYSRSRSRSRSREKAPRSGYRSYRPSYSSHWRRGHTMDSRSSDRSRDRDEDVRTYHHKPGERYEASGETPIPHAVPHPTGTLSYDEHSNLESGKERPDFEFGAKRPKRFKAKKVGKLFSKCAGPTEDDFESANQIPSRSLKGGASRDGLSVEESNAVRAQLGLKPLS